MLTNRMTQHLEEIGFEESDSTWPSSGFMLAPAGLTFAAGQAQLLQWAYEKAQATTKPSWPDRDVLGSWN